MIRRTIVTRNKDTILRLYKTLVRPQLEYCSQVWSPYLKQLGHLKTGESAKKSHENDSGLHVFKLRGTVDKVSAVRPLLCSRTPCVRNHHMVSPQCRISSPPTTE